jgi:hypothetical protein
MFLAREAELFIDKAKLMMQYPDQLKGIDMTNLTGHIERGGRQRLGLWRWLF